MAVQKSEWPFDTPNLAEKSMYKTHNKGGCRRNRFQIRLGRESSLHRIEKSLYFLAIFTIRFLHFNASIAYFKLGSLDIQKAYKSNISTNLL